MVSDDPWCQTIERRGSGAIHQRNRRERAMQVRDDHLQYFATDLTDFLACRHLSTLERLSAHGVLKRPFTDDPMLEVLRARGLEHEAQYVATLRASGKSVVEISKNDPAPFAKTLTALRG